MGRRIGNTPRDHKKQNKEIDEIARQLKLTKDERRELHDLISKRGFNFKEILELAREWFNK